MFSRYSASICLFKVCNRSTIATSLHIILVSSELILNRFCNLLTLSKYMSTEKNTVKYSILKQMSYTQSCTNISTVLKRWSSSLEIHSSVNNNSSFANNRFLCRKFSSDLKYFDILHFKIWKLFKNSYFPEYLCVTIEY